MAETLIHGTTTEVPVVRAVDGDTVKIELDGEEENLRILALDTEESRAGSGKPRTPWGEAAKAEAESFFEAGETITIEFPGTEPLEECLKRYRGNYGRPLVYVYRDGEDFVERMIRTGFSPYFTKYGYAEFESHHRRYVAAEREAQAARIGVWNQLEVNGAVMRNYSALGVWWTLRAELIEAYRRARTAGAAVLDSRLDYEELAERVGDEVTVFTELDSYRRAGATHAVVDIGSLHQPFKLFLPDALETTAGQRVLSLLDERYVSEGYDGATIEEPRRSYAYVRGELALYRDEPEIVVTSVEQLADSPPSA